MQGLYLPIKLIVLRKESPMEILKEISLWLSILGTPTICAMVVWCIKECRSFTKQHRILQKAQKAQMRSQLLSQYYIYKDQGFVFADQLDDWMNQYKAYHYLVGDNGVLDARKSELEHMESRLRA